MARRTKEEAEETRQRLLDVAEEVFRAQGVSTSSLEQLAQMAGTTRGAIQWHFKDKVGLFEAMLTRVATPIQASVQERVDAASVLPLTVIVASIQEPLRILATDERTRNVVAIASHMMEYTPELAALRAHTMATQEVTARRFTAALREGARQHGVKLRGDPTMAARGLYALLFGLMESWVLNPGAFDLRKAGGSALLVHLTGLGFDEATLALYGLRAAVRRTTSAK